jgi:hypothetical protein
MKNHGRYTASRGPSTALRGRNHSEEVSNKINGFIRSTCGKREGEKRDQAGDGVSDGVVPVVGRGVHQARRHGRELVLRRVRA